MLQYVLLWILHLIVALKRFASTLLPRRRPRPLRTRRRKLPRHLAVMLRSEGSLGSKTIDLEDALESVKRLVAWCRVAGVQVLSVYDEAGMLVDSWKQVQAAVEGSYGRVNVDVPQEVQQPVHKEMKGSTFSTALRLPPTPPLSKSTSASSLLSTPPELRKLSSLPGSNGHKRPFLVRFDLLSSLTGATARAGQSSVLSGDGGVFEEPLTLYLLSKELGKPRIARLAGEIASSAISERIRGDTGKPLVSVSSISSRLEDVTRSDGWPCPDLLLIHTPVTSHQPQLSPLEFEGFPPWQMHLTEITYIPPGLPQMDWLRRFWSMPSRFPSAITEHAFRLALDEYDGAEMRFGK